MSGESEAKLTDVRRIQNAPQIRMSKTLDRIGKSVHSILPEKIESHELSDKEQLQEYSFAPAIRETAIMTVFRSNRSPVSCGYCKNFCNVLTGS